MEPQQVYLEFRRKQKLQILVSVGLLAVMVIVLIIASALVHTEKMFMFWVFLVGLSGFVAGAVFSAYNWTCPACKEMLGRGLPKGNACRSCGVKLAP